MDDFKRYWRLVLRLGIERADKNEFWVTFALLVIAPIATAILGYNLQFGAMQWSVAVLGVVLFDLLVIIPAKIGLRYVRLIKPKFLVAVEKEPVVSGNPAPGTDRALFWRIKVRNGSKTIIPRCYAQIEEFHWVNEDNGELRDDVTKPWPKPGHDLPWARQSGGLFEKDLGSEEIAYVDYAVRQSGATALFTIPTHPDSSNTRPSYNAFILPIGIYEIVISVCSRGKETLSSKVRFRFNFGGEQTTTGEITSN